MDENDLGWMSEGQLVQTPAQNRTTVDQVAQCSTDLSTE